MGKVNGMGYLNTRLTESIVDNEYRQPYLIDSEIGISPNGLLHDLLGMTFQSETPGSEILIIISAQVWRRPALHD